MPSKADLATQSATVLEFRPIPNKPYSSPSVALYSAVPEFGLFFPNESPALYAHASDLSLGLRRNKDIEPWTISH
jgi:hypothetical protein